MSFGSRSVFRYGWGTVQTVNAVPEWRGDNYGDTRCKYVEWCQVVGFCWYGLRPLYSL